MKLLIIGPQGSGKTIQAAVLARKFDICHISSGDLARKKAQEDSEEGRAFKAALDQGEMVDDTVVARLVMEIVEGKACKNGFVLDGYPRRISQIEAYDPKADRVFYLKISDETGWKRMEGRRRSDDTPQLMRKRLELYHQRTKPVIDYYKNLGILVEINGEESITEVTQNIISHLKSS